MNLQWMLALLRKGFIYTDLFFLYSKYIFLVFCIFNYNRTGIRRVCYYVFANIETCIDIIYSR